MPGAMQLAEEAADRIRREVGRGDLGRACASAIAAAVVEELLEIALVRAGRVLGDVAVEPQELDEVADLRAECLGGSASTSEREGWADAAWRHDQLRRTAPPRPEFTGARLRKPRIEVVERTRRNGKLALGAFFGAGGRSSSGGMIPKVMFVG